MNLVSSPNNMPGLNFLPGTKISMGGRKSRRNKNKKGGSCSSSYNHAISNYGGIGEQRVSNDGMGGNTNNAILQNMSGGNALPPIGSGGNSINIGEPISMNGGNPVPIQGGRFLGIPEGTMVPVLLVAANTLYKKNGNSKKSFKYNKYKKYNKSARKTRRR